MGEELALPNPNTLLLLVSHLTPSDDRKAGGSNALDVGVALETGNVERSLAKIFREKVKVFGNVQFTQVWC